MKTIMLTLAFLLGGCVSVSAEEPQLCVSHQFDVPPVPVVGHYVIGNSYTASLKDLDFLDNLSFAGGSLSGDGLVNVSNVEIDINGITVVNVPNAGQTTITLLSSPANLAPTIDMYDGLSITITLTFDTTTIQTSDWMLNSDLCLSGAIDKHYGL